MLIVNLDLIKKKRVELNYTQSDMAEKLCLSSPEKYSRRERGEYNFKATELPILARTLGVDVNDLFLYKTMR